MAPNDLNMDDALHCVKCGAAIQRMTADRHRGRCAPCSKKRLRHRLKFMCDICGIVLNWPFVIVFLGIPFVVARCIPGTRTNFVARINVGWKPKWAAIYKYWSNAKDVYSGSVDYDPRRNAECLVLRQVVLDSSIHSNQIWQAISDGNVMLSAYCILALSRRGEHDLLKALPPTITQSRSAFRHLRGCLECDESLAELIQTELATPLDAKLETP